MTFEGFIPPRSKFVLEVTGDAPENFEPSRGKFLEIQPACSYAVEKNLTDGKFDAIMIHSRKKNPDEIFAFAEFFREIDKTTPLVVVPTSFNSVTEDEFKARGFNVVIYANQLTRSAFPAMEQTAETILRNHRALEADAACMPFKEIIRLIPEE